MYQNVIDRDKTKKTEQTGSSLGDEWMDHTKDEQNEMRVPSNAKKKLLLHCYYCNVIL